MGRLQKTSSQDDNDILQLSIAGDAVEQSRIQLERNLQDLSLQLSITNPSQASDNEMNNRSHAEDNFQADYEDEADETYSLEYPRHNSGAHDMSIFHGYDSSVMDRSHLTNDYDPHLYSHPTADIDGGIHNYGVDTLSTAAHHASALTLTAGLTGKGRRRGHVSDASMSGAEFDADRPFENIVNGIRKDFSIFDMDSTRSRARNRSHMSIPASQAEPIIVEDTADLDDALRSQDRFSARKLRKEMSAYNTRSPTNAHLLSQTQLSPHQKLATVLHKVGNTFSPKRPRGVQNSLLNYVSEDEATPRAKPRIKNFNVAIQPPTPSDGNQFSRMARDLANDIEASHRHIVGSTQSANDRISAHSTTKSNKQGKSTQRNPFHDLSNHYSTPDERKGIALCRSPTEIDGPKSRYTKEKVEANFSRTREKVHLPDVTGLTSAVGTPLKARNEWQKFVLNNDDSDVENYFVRTLTALQTQLNQLESQNLVSRRRIRELELELDACKLEVKRERTRVLEREEIIVAQEKEVEKQKKGKEKQKGRRIDEAFADENRYREIIEEKKALEALITTLRTHLTRLTAELSSHQELLAELRVLRDADHLIMQEKMSEVDKLKTEVERLAEEVEVLRGVVEQGLQERRRARENGDIPPVTSHPAAEDQPTQDILNGADSNLDEFQERSRSVTPTPPSRPQSRLQQTYPDKTVRTDHATVGSSILGATTMNPFYDPNRSRYSSPDADHDEIRASGSVKAQSSPEYSSNHTQAQIEEMVQNLRPQHTTSRRRVSDRAPQDRADKEEPKTPFPQIRGKQLERLFFSAPEHNARTCAVCHRRRRPSSPIDEDIRVPWSRPQQFRSTVPVDDFEDQSTQDEEVNASQDVECREKHQDVHSRRQQKKPVSIGEDRLPPQTVLARVLRDLEDDFTHYKAIYIELADQYKEMDAVSNVLKRNVLAEHLKEVIDTLERKGDQIAQLYDLLAFEDKPITQGPATAQNYEPSILWKRFLGRRKGLIRT